jgi:hypothetical protein
LSRQLAVSLALVAASVSPWDCRVVAGDALAAQGCNAKATCATPHSSLSFPASAAAYMQHKPKAQDIGQQQHGNGTLRPFFGFT